MSIRSFIAIPIPDHIIEHLARLHESVPHAAGKIRWVKSSAMHLTCVFLGDIEPDQVDPIAGALVEVVAAVSPFVTSFDSVGAFPNFRRPRVVWVGFGQGAEEVIELKRGIDAALQPLGFEPERRQFHPHLTLGRVKSEGRRGLLEEAAAAWTLPYENWISRELILFQSILSRHGPTYNPLARLPLGGA